MPRVACLHQDVSSVSLTASAPDAADLECPVGEGHGRCEQADTIDRCRVLAAFVDAGSCSGATLFDLRAPAPPFPGGGERGPVLREQIRGALPITVGSG